MKKRLIGIILSLAMAFSIVQMTTGFAFAEATGTEDNPYLLASETDINGIQAKIDACASSTIYFKATEDITLSSIAPLIDLKSKSVIIDFDGKNLGFSGTEKTNNILSFKNATKNTVANLCIKNMTLTTTNKVKGISLNASSGTFNATFENFTANCKAIRTESAITTKGQSVTLKGNVNIYSGYNGDAAITINCEKRDTTLTIAQDAVVNFFDNRKPSNQASKPLILCTNTGTYSGLLESNNYTNLTQTSITGMSGYDLVANDYYIYDYTTIAFAKDTINNNNNANYSAAKWYIIDDIVLDNYFSIARNEAYNLEIIGVGTKKTISYSNSVSSKTENANFSFRSKDNVNTSMVKIENIELKTSEYNNRCVFIWTSENYSGRVQLTLKDVSLNQTAVYVDSTLDNLGAPVVCNGGRINIEGNLTVTTGEGTYDAFDLTYTFGDAILDFTNARSVTFIDNRLESVKSNEPLIGFDVDKEDALYYESYKAEVISPSNAGLFKVHKGNKDGYAILEYPKIWQPYYETLALKIAACAEIEAERMLEEAKAKDSTEKIEEPVVATPIELIAFAEKVIAPNNKNSIKITWADKNAKELTFSGYEIYRATNNSNEYKFMFDTTNEYYYNTLIRKGQKYSYKVKGYNIVDGKKDYCEFSETITIIVK